MFTSCRRASVTGLLAILPITATAQDVGRIAGRVTAAETGIGLEGASLRLVGTSLTATTDERGNFVFPRVAAGAATVRASYIGREPGSVNVTVSSRETARADLQMRLVSLAPIVVEAVRAKGQADALSRQQSAPNIMSIVAADQMGRFPDASAPEAVQRLPGVAIERDQGEGRYIKVRGASAAQTQVTVNGEQVPSPEATARQIALDAVPVAVLEAVEVSKAITPNMDADAIGGAVNLVTRSAPDRRTFMLESSGGYVPIRSDYSGNGSFTWGNRTADGKLGALISGSFSRRNFGSDGIEPDYDLGDTRADDALSELDVRHYTLWRSRLGATGSFDYQLGEGSALRLTGLFSELTDHEQRRRLTHAVEDGEITYAHKNRKEILSTLNLAAGGDHLARNGLRLDYRFAFTRSQEDTPFDDEVFFLAEGISFNPALADPQRPQPNANTLSGPFLFDEAAPGTTLTKNRDFTAGANLAIPFSMGASATGTVKFGGKFRDKRKDQQVTEREIGLADGANDIELGTAIGSPFDNNGFNPGTYLIPFTTSPADIHSFRSRFASQLGEAELNLEEETNDYVLRERVLAGYVMAELPLSSRFMLLPGIRFERTSLDTDGFEFDSETEELTPASASNSYNNIFPMVHARVSIDESTNLRGAFTSTIFRPNFFDLVPFRIRDDEDLAIGNPAIEASTSRNFDLLFERYDRNIGLVSAGVFYKQIDKPIFLSTTDNELGGETEQPVNATDGSIVGFELALQKRFSSLPGFWGGLGMFANFTWTDSKATQPNGRETRLAGQADRVANFALSYERGRFSGQVSTNFTGNSILEAGEDAEDDLFIAARTQVDASASLFISNSTQLFVEALNLGNTPYRTYVINTDRPRQIEYYEPWMQVGLRWRP